MSIFRPVALGALLLISGLLPARAQSAENGGMVYYTVGGNLLNPSALNTQLQPAGYQSFDSWSWGQGIGLYGVFKRVMVGLEYQSLFGQLVSQNQDYLRLDGSYATLDAGYMVIATPTFQVYPYIGIGRGLMNLRGSQTLNGPLGVSQGSNQNLNTVSAGSWLLDFGLGANLTLPMSTGSSDPRGPAASLRAGYLLPLGTTEWSSNQLPVSGGPALSPGGFYLRLMLGFGGLQ